MKWIIALLALTSPAMAQQSFEDYAASCALQVAPIPDFSCGDGELVPITVNGQTPSEYTADMTCDNPAVLPNGDGSDGQCVPGSRILDLSTDTVQITAMCRQKTIRSPVEALVFNEIDIIAHNPSTGATCWFQAEEASLSQPIDGSNIISPNSEGAASFWNPISKILTADCGGCHDNDPIMYSPFLAPVWSQIATNPLGLYFHIEPEMGFNLWPVTAMNPQDNTCLGCHRIGIQETCGPLLQKATGLLAIPGADALASRFPGNVTMPPLHGLTQTGWETIHQNSVAVLQSCCEDKTQAMCNLSQIPSLPPMLAD